MGPRSGSRFQPRVQSLPACNGTRNGTWPIRATHPPVRVAASGGLLLLRFGRQHTDDHRIWIAAATVNRQKLLSMQHPMYGRFSLRLACAYVIPTFVPPDSVDPLQRRIELAKQPLLHRPATLASFALYGADPGRTGARRSPYALGWRLLER